MKKHKTIKTRKKIFPALLVLVLVLTIISCQQGSAEKADGRTGNLATERRAISADSAYVVEVTAADYAFGMPTEVPSGWVTFRMKNMGQEEHNGIIYKYTDSLTYEDLGKLIGEALQKEEIDNSAHPFNSQIEKPMGGPAILSPGLTGETTVLLEPGTYALTCWMVAEDGEFHAMKGMTRPFIVTDENSGAKKPEATVDITLRDVAIDIEDSIAAGKNVFNVKFERVENVHLARLGEGQEFEELKEWMNKVQNPSPFTFLGGAEQAPVGTTNTFTANLEPGRYALVSYGNAIHGMAAEITVPKNGKAAPVPNKPVNPPVTIRTTTQGIELPEIKAGRTPIILATSEDNQGFYVFGRLKKGKSRENIIQYFENYAEERPYQPIWWGTVTADEKINLNLEMQDGTYLLAGPLPLEDQVPEQWKADEVIHIFKVDAENQ